MTESLYLRVSVTERCNLRCQYCRSAREPSGEAGAIGPTALARLVSAIHAVRPVRKVRLTGGEPLLRRDIKDVVRALHGAVPSAELAITTNGVLLAPLAAQLRAAGVEAVNVSLDTTDQARFAALTRGGRLGRVLDGLAAAVDAGFPRLKMNAVLMRHQNGHCLVDLVRLAAAHGAEMRFIELMPFGVGKALYASEFLSAAEARQRLERSLVHLGAAGRSGTADRHRFRDGDHLLTVGFITPVSEPFCASCDRLRLDSRGRLWTCLRGNRHFDLRTLLREPSPAELERCVRDAIAAKSPPSAAWVEREMAAIGG